MQFRNILAYVVFALVFTACGGAGDSRWYTDEEDSSSDTGNDSTSASEEGQTFLMADGTECQCRCLPTEIMEVIGAAPTCIECGPEIKECHNDTSGSAGAGGAGNDASAGTAGVTLSDGGTAGVGETTDPPPSDGGSAGNAGSPSVSTGGVEATGGTGETTDPPSATGGTISTGGTSSTGGTVSTGGVEESTGGTGTTEDPPPATGGTISTGGTSSTGGTISTGGVEETGGTGETTDPPPTGGMAGAAGEGNTEDPPTTGGTAGAGGTGETEDPPTTGGTAGSAGEGNTEDPPGGECPQQYKLWVQQPYDCFSYYYDAFVVCENQATGEIIESYDPQCPAGYCYFDIPDTSDPWACYVDTSSTTDPRIPAYNADTGACEAIMSTVVYVTTATHALLYEDGSWNFFYDEESGECSFLLQPRAGISETGVTCE